MLCLFLPMTLMAQAKHKYLDHALPEAWQENDSNFQQTLPVDDNWWRNFNDPVLDSLIDVAVKQNYSVQMAADRIAMAKANLRIHRAVIHRRWDYRRDGTGNKAAATPVVCRKQSPNMPMPRSP